MEHGAGFGVGKHAQAVAGDGSGARAVEPAAGLGVRDAGAAEAGGTTGYRARSLYDRGSRWDAGPEAPVAKLSRGGKAHPQLQTALWLQLGRVRRQLPPVWPGTSGPGNGIGLIVVPA